MNPKSKQTILECYERFHRPEFLELDPLSIIRTFQGQAQVEEVALIGALFAFGAVGQINKSLTSALERTPRFSESEPIDEKKRAQILYDSYLGFRHRIYVDRDLVMLKLLYRRSWDRFGSLQNHFASHHSGDSETIGDALAGVIRDYRRWVDEIEFKAGPHFKHMLNSPEQKSACKRWLMYLKWVIRADDGFDLGLWSSGTFRPDQLVIPLDTHLFRISRNLRLTRRKSANWLSAIEVTRKLKSIDPDDPTRFDFSLCRIGMLKFRNRI
jgi:uncharacterized protein (TIGR02757 family)